MIVLTIKRWLEQKLSVPVYMEIPSTPPVSFVVLEVKGMGRENHLHSAMAILQSYGSSLYAAAELNEQVKAAMNNLALLRDISRCELNSDYNYTDTASKRYRWQAVFDIKHY